MFPIISQPACHVHTALSANRSYVTYDDGALKDFLGDVLSDTLCVRRSEGEDDQGGSVEGPLVAGRARIKVESLHVPLTRAVAAVGVGKVVATEGLGHVPGKVEAVEVLVGTVLQVLFAHLDGIGLVHDAYPKKKGGGQSQNEMCLFSCYKVELAGTQETEQALFGDERELLLHSCNEWELLFGLVQGPVREGTQFVDVLDIGLRLFELVVLVAILFGGDVLAIALDRARTLASARV